jgi:hypothetical protein
MSEKPIFAVRWMLFGPENVHSAFGGHFSAWQFLAVSPSSDIHRLTHRPHW